MQDGSVDVTQIDNEFHRVRYVDYMTGELKNKFISFEEKVGVGSVGQYDCLKKSIVSLYPNNDKVSVDSIIELLQKQHLNPPTDQEENEDVKDMSEEDHIFDADAPF